MKLAATIVCALACLALVVAEARHSRARFVAKPLASAAFIAVGLHAPAWIVGGLVLGAIAFFASDLSVARDKFVVRNYVNRAWGLPAYYAGQLLIAWSLS